MSKKKIAATILAVAMFTSAFALPTSPITMTVSAEEAVVAEAAAPNSGKEFYEEGPVIQNGDGDIEINITEEQKEKTKDVLEIVVDFIVEVLVMLLEAVVNILNKIFD